MRKDRLTAEERERCAALARIAGELVAKLDRLAEDKVRSVSYEDLELDSAEYAASMILRRIKQMRGTDKVLRERDATGLYAPGTR